MVIILDVGDEMKYCPKCSKLLKEEKIDNQIVKTCSCGYLDYNNWVFIACVVCAFNENNEFLMVRLKGKEEGKVTFPGGFRNLNETLEDAAKREFYEETGYTIDEPKLFKVFTRDDLRLVWITYTAYIKDGEFKENDETSEVIFCSRNNLPKESEIRGNLTEQLINDILKMKT